MPRAPFDTTADVYAGPGTATPGAFKRTVNARLVQDLRKAAERPNAIACFIYINCDGPLLLAGTTTVLPPNVTIHTDKADVLECPSGSGQFFTVVRCEAIIPRRAGLTPYNRAHVQ